MIVNKEEWIPTNHKPLRHPNNKEFVTGRANIVNKKKVIRISIGVDVCEVLSFNKNDRIDIYINAESQAKANKILADSLTAEFVSYQAILRWDGKLPTMTGTGAIPFINVKGKSNE